MLKIMFLYSKNEDNHVQNTVKFFYKTNLVVFLILPLFLDKIQMPQDSPLIMQGTQTAFCCERRYLLCVQSVCWFGEWL